MAVVLSVAGLLLVFVLAPHDGNHAMATDTTNAVTAQTAQLFDRGIREFPQTPTNNTAVLEKWNHHCNAFGKGNPKAISEDYATGAVLTAMNVGNGTVSEYHGRQGVEAFFTWMVPVAQSCNWQFKLLSGSKDTHKPSIKDVSGWVSEHSENYRYSNGWVRGNSITVAYECKECTKFPCWSIAFGTDTWIADPQSGEYHFHNLYYSSKLYETQAAYDAAH